jgi:FAD:protein FMN transferase
LLPLSLTAQVKKVHQEFSMMGTKFGFTLILSPAQQDSSEIFIQTASTEVERIESLISSWNETSETAKINRNAGIRPTKISFELFQLIKRGQSIANLTSYAGLNPIWKFDGTMTELPDSALLAKSKALIDYSRIHLDEMEKSVFLEKKGMRIGFGGIGKGYAANRVRDLMKKMGVNSGAIDAGGDIITWGKNEAGKPWKVGIRKPGAEEKPIGFIDVTEMAVVTSGNYERFAIINGNRYTHIIDPRTGWPAVGLKSVTIVCSDAELADALATAVFVLGKEVGLDLIEQMIGVECVAIDDADHIFTTKGIALLRD